MTKTITVANVKGGSGKTSLSRELYFSFLRTFKDTEKNVSYYDLDTQDGNQSQIVENSDVIIVDTPGAMIDDLGDLMESSDLVVIPSRMTARDLPVLQTMIDLANARAQCPVLYVLTCWNRFSAAKAFQQVFDSFNVEYSCIIPQSEAFSQASACDCSVVEIYPRTSFPVTATMNFVNSARKLIGYPEETAFI